MRRFFSDAYAPKSVVKLATLIRSDRTVGRIHLPLVWRTKLLGEFLKEALDCESSDVPLDVDVQGSEAEHQASELSAWYMRSSMSPSTSG
jgi:hypothetical protein